MAEQKRTVLVVGATGTFTGIRRTIPAQIIDVAISPGAAALYVVGLTRGTFANKTFADS